MIRKLKINNFKSLVGLELKMGSLNVLTGKNSSGKSSVIQTLLTINQSRIDQRSDALYFDGSQKDMVNLGTYKDVYSLIFNSKNIEVAIDFDRLSMEISTEPYSIENNNLKWVRSSFTNNPHDFDFTLEPLFYEVQYLQALRSGPKSSFSTPPIRTSKSVHKTGEFAAHVLDTFGIDKKITNPKILIGEQVDLAGQVGAWMSEICGINMRVDTKLNPATSEIDITYKLPKVGDRRDVSLKPLHLGFGLSYLFPIVVALLNAEKGDLIIIENPESDLHASAQSKLGWLITLIAESGVQIIVETHSEHILNGIRKAVKVNIKENEDSSLNNDDVFIYFFEKNSGGESQAHRVTLNDMIRFDTNGHLAGFFDQLENDLIEIL